MTLGGLFLLFVIAAVIGAIFELIMGIKTGADWIGTIIVGFLGAWVGSALFRIGPIFSGVYLTSAIFGAIVLVFLLKLVTVRHAT